MRKNDKKEEKKDIFELLEHYKCTICKEEFYLLKDEKDKDDEIFQDEEYSHLPIFVKSDPKKITCPYCKASKRSLLYIETEKEKKSKLEKMKEELKKLKEEEKKLDEKKEKEIDKLCSEIEDDIMSNVKEIMSDLKSEKYNIDYLLKNFKDKAYDIVSRDTKMYNRINKDIDIVLSNRYLAGFSRVISDFTTSISDAYKTLDINSERIKQKEEIMLEKTEKDDEVGIEKIKDSSEEDIDKEKDKNKESVSTGKDEFIKYLKKLK